MQHVSDNSHNPLSSSSDNLLILILAALANSNTFFPKSVNEHGIREGTVCSACGKNIYVFLACLLHCGSFHDFPDLDGLVLISFICLLSNFFWYAVVRKFH